MIYPLDEIFPSVISFRIEDMTEFPFFDFFFIIISDEDKSYISGIIGLFLIREFYDNYWSEKGVVESFAESGAGV